MNDSINDCGRLENVMPNVGVPLRYQRTYLAASKWPGEVLDLILGEDNGDCCNVGMGWSTEPVDGRKDGSKFFFNVNSLMMWDAGMWDTRVHRMPQSIWGVVW